MGGQSHLPQEVHDGAEVSWDDQDQSHCGGKYQGRSWCEAMNMNHGQKLGLGAKPGVSPPREPQQVSALGSSQSSSPAKLTLDTSGPNLIVPSLHRFRM